MSNKRSSPDTVVCIDLTEDDDDDHQQNLEVVRKRLKSSPSAEAGKLKNEEPITIDDSDDDDGGGKIGSCAALQQQAMKHEASTLALSSEVEIIERVEPVMHPVAAAAAARADDDIEVVGTTNESRLPHMRQHCTDKKFVKDVLYLQSKAYKTTEQNQAVQDGLASNSTCCDLCYCYVCDKPAKECTSWVSSLETPSKASRSSHCHASDTGYDSGMWKTLRTQCKRNADNANAIDAIDSALQALMGRRPNALPVHARTPAQRHPARQPGPFPPDDQIALQDPSLIKCRKCHWHNRPYTNETPTSFLDWCHACGRIASEDSFGRHQVTKRYVRKPGDVFLGEKVIPFRIVAHDPRKFDKFKQRWLENESDPKWSYSAAEMEEDVFHHRLGRHPTLEILIASITVFSPEKIPETGSLFSAHMTSEPWMRGVPDIAGEVQEKEVLSADETDAVIVEKHVDRILLRELRNYRSIGVELQPSRPGHQPYRDSLLGGDIEAFWDAEARSGTLKVRLYVHPDAFGLPAWRHGREGTGNLAKVLGAWFDVFPFALSDLCGPMRAEETKKPPASDIDDVFGYRGLISISVPPFQLEAAEHVLAYDKIAAEMKSAVVEHNEAVKSKLATLSLNSGSDCDRLGGYVSPSPIDLHGILKAYFRDVFPEDAYSARQSSLSSENRLWIEREGGVRSSHRDLRQCGEKLLCQWYGNESTDLDSYVNDDDRVLARSNLCSDAKTILDRTRTLKGMMDHLESLHHNSVPFVDGLTVELLEFQRQSVQWALERETTPGGVQSFLWAKLPSVAEPGQDVYFNPILQCFRRDKPRLVRGGIIAEEMGLGKTVISLALILQNPAPKAPLSGSPVSALDAAGAASDATLWDKELYSRTSGSNSKRGSILSRGTLVVCHVSLVGQWIDEARSKLKDPGLVYPYHGQSRKRNAKILAKNSIVVTTYQTLASDASYHAKKAGDDYCAPCEQVRWWRIICDESHSLREANTQKSTAVMKLVADHKWLVSGTPVNTSFKDLKNQLNFIGLDDVDLMFESFMSSAFRHCKDRSAPQKRQYWDSRSFGHFAFLMRNIMIRHTHNQTYRGTTTTLMSLPPKTERKIEVEFTNEEKQEYLALDNAARDFYIDFKATKGHELSKHFLLLSQKLMKIRIAASGGKIPLDDEEDEQDDNSHPANSDDEASDEEGTEKKRKKPKKEQRFSDFAYRSKLDTLITELERARVEDPHAKSLVFSQFTSTLQWLQEELPKHGFQFRTLSGDMPMKKRAKALHDFQHDPPTTIFLLSMRAGAVGINLTQANRVFLMEPSFTPALELQAIGRVHRLGQKRNVEVVRLIMKDSVESRILKMLDKKYGTGGSNAGDEEADAKDQEIAMLVGSIHSERTKVLGDEFDILFGVPSTSSAEAVAADPMVSSSTSVEM